MQGSSISTGKNFGELSARGSDRVCPLGFSIFPSLNGDIITITIEYWAHRFSPDPERSVVTYTMDRFLPKQMIIDKIQDEYLENPFMLSVYFGQTARRSKDIQRVISNMLIADFESNPKYKNTDLLRIFREAPKYQSRIDALAECEAIVFLLKQLKSFYGEDIRVALSKLH